MTPDDLTKFVKSLAKEPRAPFIPHADYVPEGDLLQVFLKDDQYYGQWFNHQITVFRSIKTNRIIGVEVCGVRQLINKEPDGKP